MKNIIMPKLSDTMTEGLLGSWLKNVGDTISRGDIIAEVETDKATMGLEAFDDGVLLEQRIRAGETVPVGTVLGTMGMPGELPAVEPSDEAPATTVESAVTEPHSDEMAAVRGAAAETAAVEVEPSGAGEVVSREKASPVVRRKARELGIDLETVQGSGAGGRVLLEDLENISGITPSAAVAGDRVAIPAGSTAGKAGGESRAARMRGAIAVTVGTSWREIPHFYVTMEISMDHAEEIRRELQMTGSPVSVNDLVLKGITLALPKYPLLNALYTDDGLVPQNDINLGIVVNVTSGLLVPVLKGAGALTLVELAEQSRKLVERAREGVLAPADMSGGSFSVSNLGPLGVSQFTALILPPQVAMLAVGAVGETVVAMDGEMVVGRIMRVTLSADHRAVDGAYAAGFLQEFKSVLENPVRLLI